MKSTESPIANANQIPGYEILELLDKGGMGAVYRGRHRRLDRMVAIKLLPSRYAKDPEAIARFQHEMRAVGRLHHPSIITATDAGEHHGTHFLVMELVDGLDLARIARALGRLPIAEACELIRQAALGLEYVHAQGVVHRDIKPSNLMLDRQGRIKILDLGLAQLGPWQQSVDEYTTVGQLIGTLDYMAPEQSDSGRRADYRSDLYSLGATLYRLLCGRAPYAITPHLSPLEKLRLLASSDPPRMRRTS
jgi:serine/threonine protein kinase